MHGPLIYPLIALIAGIIGGYYLAVPGYLLFGGIIVILIFLLAVIIKKWTASSFFLIIIFTFLLGCFDIQSHKYLIQSDEHISRYINAGKLVLEGVVIENPFVHPDKLVLFVRCQRIINDKSYIPVSGEYSPGDSF